MSRLDRFIYSPEMQRIMEDCVQLALKRKISDHCHVFLKPYHRDWGPRPFKSLNCWTGNPDFLKVASDLWNNYQVNGWAGYRCKEKLKTLKLFLKEWNKSKFGNFDEQIKSETDKIAGVDLSNELCDLTENEVLLRSEAFFNIWRLMHRKESSLKKKSITKWFKYSDANTAYFHKSVSRRRRRNWIQGLNIDGNWVENPNLIKFEAARYSEQRFTPSPRPRLKFPIQSSSIFLNLITIGWFRISPWKGLKKQAGIAAAIKPQVLTVSISTSSKLSGIRWQKMSSNLWTNFTLMAEQLKA